MSRTILINDKVWVRNRERMGTVTSVDHNGMYYVDLTPNYDGAEIDRVTSFRSGLTYVDNFSTKDRVFHKRKGKYGTIERVTSSGIGVTFDNEPYTVYLANPIELMLSWEEKERTKPEIKVGTRVKINNSSTCATVIERDGDSVSLALEFDNSEMTTSIFLVDATKKQPNKTTKQVKDRRYSVLASWIKDGKRVHRIISVQQLVIMIRKNRTVGLRSKMFKSGVVYPGTAEPSEKDNNEFIKLIERIDNESRR